MPEGPSIVILKEQLQQFKKMKVIMVEGNSKLPIQQMLSEKIIDFRSWGKQLLICFQNFTVSVHLMLFGSYKINERKNMTPRLRLIFRKGEINFYACVIRFIEGDILVNFDWTADVMSDSWDPAPAKKKLKLIPAAMISDALLNQEIFSGVGNIIKNEVLFRVRIHPESIVSHIPAKKISQLIKEVRNYSFEFLEWKKKFELRKHWLVYKKQICPRDHVPFFKKYVGNTNRITFYCEQCQVCY
jgi:endonuclease-8